MSIHATTHSLVKSLFYFCLGAFALSTIAKAEPLPVSAFSAMPSLSSVQLSPDGTHLMALQNIAGTTVVMTQNLTTGEIFYPAKTDNLEYKFNWIQWANNDRILMSLRFDKQRHGSDIHFYYTRLLAVDAKKESKMMSLVKMDDGAQFESQFQDTVLGKVPSEPDNILIGVDKKLFNHQTVYKVDVNNGKSKIVQNALSTVRTWVADRQGNVRIAENYDDSTKKITIKVLDEKTKEWKKAWEYIQFDEPSISILGFGGKNTDLFLLADYQGRQALYKADLSKEGYPWELILSDEHNDINGSLIYIPSLQEVVGIYYNDGKSKSVFWNKDFNAFQLGLNKALPNAENYIVSLSDNSRRYIVYSHNDTNPGSYYFGDRDTKTLSPIGDAYPQLTADVLIKKELLPFKARDGLALDGFLSRPKNTTKPIATIILPHGGPMAEDGIGFDEFSSFLVNRGYAVFQPNFRGSSGKGHEFMMQAIGGMGLAMQDDLEDAVTFLVNEKIADPKQMCIVGASYGGYAALMGATKTPDLFQCAISFAGISDLKKLRDGSRFYHNKKAFREQIGNDIEQLKKTSPVRMVDKIKIPILLIHGSDDVNVPVVQSRIMADELKEKNKVYEYIELKEGTHNLDYLPHREKTFNAMDAFLKKYLPLH